VDASVRYTLGEIHSTRIRAFDRWQSRPRSRAAQRPWTESISARNSTDSPGNAVHLIALSLQRVEDGAKSAQSVERAGADRCASQPSRPIVLSAQCARRGAPVERHAFFARGDVEVNRCGIEQSADMGVAWFVARATGTWSARCARSAYMTVQMCPDGLGEQRRADVRGIHDAWVASAAPKDALTRRPIVHCGRSVNGRVVIGRVIEYPWADATHASDDSDEASIFRVQTAITCRSPVCGSSASPHVTSRHACVRLTLLPKERHRRTRCGDV
jgi:hypothetical protein